MMDVANVKQTFLTYTGNAAIWVIVLAAAVFLWLRAEKPVKMKVIWTAVIAFACVYNDLARGVIGKVTGTATYYRFLWLIPVVYVLAALMAAWLTDRTKKGVKILAAAVLAICVFFAGDGGYFSRDVLRLPENEYGISNDVIEVCAIVQENKREQQSVVLTDMSLIYTIRAYDPDILWPCSRKAWMYVAGRPTDEQLERYRACGTLIRLVQYGIQPEGADFAKAVKKKNVEFIVVPNEADLDAYLADNGFYAVGAGSNYTVYQTRDDPSPY